MFKIRLALFQSFVRFCENKGERETDYERVIKEKARQKGARKSVQFDDMKMKMKMCSFETSQYDLAFYPLSSCMMILFATIP